jgi:hypothetical protein
MQWRVKFRDEMGPAVQHHGSEAQAIRAACILTDTGYLVEAIENAEFSVSMEQFEKIYRGWVRHPW